ncbi:MAG TPA: SAM-dependent methyltransferase [Chitinophagaceae bacterium]|nr:SAM-dependent methyltransferase [Chitinophagaceae bacterium]
MASTVYLIPTALDDENLQVIPAYILDAVKDCQAFFTENERTARRFLKKIWKEMVIDDYAWFTIHKAEQEVTDAFRQLLREEKNIGIISEAGCPGIADPGQLLVAAAHEAGATVRPLVGPSSILLALMASGLNGQQFQFVGYLPIDMAERVKALKELELDSKRKNCTQVFIETPYRNNPLLETIIKTCQPNTRLCIAANLTGASETVRTMRIMDWRKKMPDLHKQPAIFCLLSG